MSESPQNGSLNADMRISGVTVRMCWDLYIKFYTVFLTFSVIGLGWILTRPADLQTIPRGKQVIAIVFLIQNDPHRDNKCRNRALYSACGDRPRPHRGSPYSIAPWRKDLR